MRAGIFYNGRVSRDAHQRGEHMGRDGADVPRHLVCRGGAGMNSINRRGQKVICIIDHAIWADFCCELRWPLQDEIYTVSGFAEIDGCPGIFLHELPPVVCVCHQLDDAPWPLECFRALDERQTDISEFTKLLDRTPQLV
jgi:hypothetical protein